MCSLGVHESHDGACFSLLRVLPHSRRVFFLTPQGTKGELSQGFKIIIAILMTLKYQWREKRGVTAALRRSTPQHHCNHEGNRG